jgi:thiol-disulfide isomerase/thioredoxin
MSALCVPHTRPRPLAAFALAAALGGCAAAANHEAVTTATAPVPSARAAESAPASSSAVAATAPDVTPVVQHGLAWYHDAAGPAFARARAEDKPILVDLWAPWCHTCLSMQEYVLRAEKLPGAAEQFVFLAIDTERAENAEFLAKHSLSAWPTFYVLSPDGSVRGRWIGAASPGQFARFLGDARRLHELASSAPNATEPLAELAAGDELAARGEFAAAAENYERALARAPRDWPRRGDALLARLMAAKKAKRAETCVDMGLTERPSAATPVSSADFAATLLACSAELPKHDARVRRARRAAVAILTPLCNEGHADFTPDDRGDACGTLIQAHAALGDEQAARTTALTRLAVLEAAAQGLPDELALMYDFARSDTLVKLGRGRDALALLRARERALPRNYNPPHQLARVHRALGEWDEGLAAIDRALGLAYGPRKAGLYGVKVELLVGKGDRAAARAALSEQLALYRALPEGQRRPDAEARVEAELARLDGR